ncbi:hypothetical protein FXN61_27235 [Lentzea sp. PSKA42]|uniref:Uncharacterized protein n=1 Tax=Lentzea indica TaxID=2604800 RepID=A0ABX1FMS5_9PSEU|nr:hypothetical protein [Lentzea indica]NKE60293.1 hypothetical protein [Lentzea indica]
MCLALSLLTGTLNTLGVVLLLILWALVTYLAWLSRVVIGLDRERRVSARAQAVLAYAGFSTLFVWVLTSALPATLEILTQLSQVILITGDIPQPWFGLGELDPPSDTAIVLLVLLMFAVVAMEALQRQLALEQLARGNRWPLGLRRRRLATFAERQAGNVTMYSGLSPFVGAGQELRTWSFALRMVRAGQPPWFAEAGRQRQAPVRAVTEENGELLFKVEDLIAHLRKQLSMLSIESEPRLVLPGLTVQDHVFQAAEGAGSLTHTMDPSAVSGIIADPTTAARHYLTCQVRSWDGEVVTTVFVHVAVQGRTLYLEFSAWMLPPTQAGYQLLRDPRRTEPGARLDAVGQALTTLPRLVVGAPFGVLRAGRDAMRAILSAALRVPAADYDFGARTSIRELGAMTLPQVRRENRDMYVPDNYFQSRDVVKYWKILERRLIAATFDFLAAHDVDTAEYAERALTVLNTGVMQFGGTMGIRDSAIGTGGSVDRSRRGKKDRSGRRGRP